MKRLLLADDHPMIRNAIEVLLRINRQQQPEDAEWERIVREFGGRHAE